MSRIVHIALKCENMEDLEKATKFYENIFGIYTTKEKHARGHLSRHMTDGNIDLALMLYDSEDEKEAKLAGRTAEIDVRFDAFVVAVTRDASGELVAGSMSDAIPTHDVWTFRRDLGSQDPNWLLVDTDEAA